MTAIRVPPKTATPAPCRRDARQLPRRDRPARCGARFNKMFARPIVFESAGSLARAATGERICRGRNIQARREEARRLENDAYSHRTFGRSSENCSPRSGRPRLAAGTVTYRPWLDPSAWFETAAARPPPARSGSSILQTTPWRPSGGFVRRASVRPPREKRSISALPRKRMTFHPMVLRR